MNEELQPGPGPRVPAIDAPHSGWKGSDLVYFGAAFIILFLSASIGVSALPFRGESADAFRALTATAVFETALIGLIYVLTRWWRGLSFAEEMRWSRGYEIGNVSLLVLGISLGLCALAVSLAFPPENTPIERLLSTSEAVMVFALFGVAVAPTVEELLFRGFLFRVLEQTMSASVAIATTAILFALLHASQLQGSWAGILWILAVGFVLSNLRARTDSLLPSIIVHTSYNGTLFLAFLAGTLAQRWA